MSAVVKKGLAWAFTALQVTTDNVLHDHDLIETPVSPVRTSFSEGGKVPLGSIDVAKAPKAETNARAAVGSKEDQENVKPRFSRQQVADHCHSGSCWMIINNKVYDVTRFLRMHPGGEDLLMEYGGHDATSAFIDKGHSPDAFEMLGQYLIGTVLENDWYPEINCT